ncbi:helix-turn-helix domain-containing protein [Sphingomicrobium arenosum]|uniref:helix-turn-helix domain-containing protein n=1 Tax=Sphingomicrobium arenosum TaxID=2233861 RepID=UPI002240F08F|nr:RodZ domain-containing protein [Sphingomicrobium arenosum]
MDEAEDGIIEEEAGTPIGEQLRAAREEKGLSLEQLASQSRIPQRHLENLEANNWSKLPAATYTVGFAKTYADAVGLDRAAVAEHVRHEMGAWQPPQSHVGVYEVADSSGGMPRWVIIAAAIAVIGAVLLFSWMNDRRLAAEEEAAGASAEVPEETAPAIAAPDLADGPVRLAATDEVWLRVMDGDTQLFEGLMSAGDDFLIPDDAVAPMLETARPEALEVTVGDTRIVQLGPDSERISDISLLGEDLVERGTREAATTGAAATSADTPATRTPSRTTRSTGRAATLSREAAPPPGRSTPPPPPPRERVTTPAATQPATTPEAAPPPASPAPTPAPTEPPPPAADESDGNGTGGSGLTGA